MRPMRFIDCHAHLVPPHVALDDIAAAVEACAKEHVYVIAVTESVSEWPTLQQLWNHGAVNRGATNSEAIGTPRNLGSPTHNHYHAQVALCGGVHPVQPNEAYTEAALNQSPNDIPSTLPKVRAVRIDECTSAWSQALPTQLPNHPEWVGIGEVGLDYSPHVLRLAGPEPSKAAQRQVFVQQIQLAQRCQLPLNVHSRQAGRYALDLIETHYGSIPSGQAAGASTLHAIPVLLHAFDGKPSVVRRGLALGCYFSIPPAVAFDPTFQRLAQLVPLDRLVLESDTPALGPVPQQPNTPTSVKSSAEHIAQVKGLTLAQVADATTRNALRLFPRLRALWPWANDYDL
ncbi:putative deoxyribonuclease tatdn3 [Dimargaris verticillata]|uniref:Deoxyribonuclease tatdn3 n=1 Tax=Dimargaris verticillata TaxID=2761393 RepID=A0A9W8AY10_9FUNG|nr:putative deoxyribonuclease tatdn3 [Dimargaris verticillata]